MIIVLRAGGSECKGEEGEHINRKKYISIFLFIPDPDLEDRGSRGFPTHVRGVQLHSSIFFLCQVMFGVIGGSRNLIDQSIGCSVGSPFQQK